MSVSPSEFLLAELRRQRTLAGLTQDELGERAHFSGKQVSAVELATRPPRQDYLTTIDKALDTGGLFVRLWADLVKDDAAPVWLREWIEFHRSLSCCWTAGCCADRLTDRRGCYASSSSIW